MGLFDFFKKKNKYENYSKSQENEIVEKNNLIPIQKSEHFTIEEKFSLHQDLVGLIWIADGKYKNYTSEPAKNINSFDIDGIKINISFSYNSEEPSLIYTKLKLINPKNTVERPSYYPSYSGLTPEQRWVYLQLLKNPYDTNIDIGYVFILYYGLERHLLLGDFDRAFDLILKLRDAHKNKSFQYYSANALILTSMFHKRGEKISDFINSLDKEYEYSFSDNLFLMCYYSLNMPLQAKDIMRMAKTFEFMNTNYIRKYPDIFCEVLSNVLFEKYGKNNVILSQFINKSELIKIQYEKVGMFANMSIIDKQISIPMLRDSFKLKKEINILLEDTHNRTKVKISAMRKDGTIKEPIINAKNEPKQKKSPIDKRLLKDLPSSANCLDKHFHYQEQIQAFYARRDEDSKYLEMAIEACKKQIAMSKDAACAFLHDNPPFERLPSHVGYKQLCIILNKQGKYSEEINLAEKAKNEGWAGDWDNRIERSRKKLQ